MMDSSVFHFLEQLEANNNRRWFVQQKEEYAAARTAVLDTLDHVIAGMARFDPPIVEQEPEDCLFRINRDLRFSRDKSPYKTHFGAFITDRGRKVDRAGYYLHVEPGDSMLAGGLYMPPAVALRAVRRAIRRDGRTLRRIISRPKFVDLFGTTLPGRRLKTAPRDVPRDHPDLDLLQLTSFEIVCPLKDARLRKKDFVEYAVGVFEAMHDYNAWLNRALDSFTPGPHP